MHSPETLIGTIRLPFTKFILAHLWHIDPGTDGTDDSCGWFKRARHGNPATLEEIRKNFEFDWDRTFTPDREDDEKSPEVPPTTYYQGFFRPVPDGRPVLSAHAIALNLYSTAAHTVMGRMRAQRFLRRHLFHILIFSENPVDSLLNDITLKFERGCNMEHTARRRAERIARMAACIYGDILRRTMPWWRHPRWHLHHWKFQFPWWQQVCRIIWSRCKRCGSRFRWNEAVVSNQWDSPGPRWGKPETWLTCAKCSGVAEHMNCPKA